MRYLGLDLGTRTLGISISDITATIANSYKTIRFNEGDYEVLIPELRNIIEEYNIEKIVLGFPKNMNNTIGERGITTLDFKEQIEKVLNIEVIMQDERLSTVEATHYMVEADMSRKKRKKKIDSLAANIILQTYLDKMKGRNL
ncbi:MAG: Holliday junction resolvase RuvX [Bacilli bacterium]|jgi:putative Holliday junction resolvase|nr:Holliday junction resolvase RuvX [Bacilli bacterium]